MPGLASGTDIEELFAFEPAMGADKLFDPFGPFEKKFELDAEHGILGMLGQGKKQYLKSGRPEIRVQKQGLLQPGSGLFRVPGLNVQKGPVIVEQKIVRIGFDAGQCPCAGLWMDTAVLILGGVFKAMLDQPFQEHEAKLPGGVFQTRIDPFAEMFPVGPIVLEEHIFEPCLDGLGIDPDCPGQPFAGLLPCRIGWCVDQ
jgi:hypothetical protein